MEDVPPTPILGVKSSSLPRKPTRNSCPCLPLPKSNKGKWRKFFQIRKRITKFFTTKPYACEPSSLPKYPPCKEMDVKLRDEEARRQRGTSFKGNLGDGTKRVRSRDCGDRAVPAPEANAELQVNLDRWRQITQVNAKSKSEKFPPPHQDAKVPIPLDASHNGPVSFVAPDTSFTSSIFEPHSSAISHSNSLRNPTVVEGSSRRKANKEELGMAPSRTFIRAFKPSSFGRAMELRLKGKQSISEVFGGS